MSWSYRLPALLAIAVATSLALGTPKVLEPAALPSPDHRCKANVEWEDIGFIGLIRMRIYQPNGDPSFAVELPEINPSPANLMWIDNEWVGCESFLGDKGSGFFYLHVPTKRAYLLEIIAPRPDADWVLSFSTNDNVSTSAIRTISKDRNSLFPVLMRDLPTEGPDYFTADFCNELREAVDDYTDYRKRQKIRTMEALSTPDVRTSVGALAVFAVDDKPSAVYFPTGTTTTAQMLERTQIKPLPRPVQELLTGTGAPQPQAKWTDNSGNFVVQAADLDKPTSITTLLRDKFEGVHDEPWIEPEPAETPAVSVTESKQKKPIPAAKGKPSRTSSKKRPSRAH